MAASNKFTPIPRTGKQGRDILALAENLELLMGARGEGLDQALTRRDLIDLGFAAQARRKGEISAALPSGLPGAPGSADTPIVVETPTAPTGVKVTASLSYALSTWNQPNFGGYANSEIFRSDTDDFATAVLVGTSNVGIYADEIDFTEDQFYWFRHVNSDDKKGPIQSTAGALLRPADRPEELLALLQDKITNDQLDEAAIFDVSTFAIRSQGDLSLTFAVHDGKVLMDAAYIHNLVVTSAQVEDLAADKITGFDASFVNGKMGNGWIGNAQIGGNLYSDNFISNMLGWIVRADGSAEFNNNVTARNFVAHGFQAYTTGGELMFGTAEGLAASYINGLGALALFDGIDYDAIWGDKPPANADVTNYDDYRVSNHVTDSGITTIAAPGGARANLSGTKTGAIVIKLPRSWSNSMLKMEIDVYLYNGAESFTAKVGGYTYTSGSWINEFAQIMGHIGGDNRVRFGHNGTVCCIVIGDTTSSWSYPKIAVRNLMVGHNGSAAQDWRDGWDVVIDSALTGFVFTGDFPDALLDAKSIQGQGALATEDGVDYSALWGAKPPADADKTSDNIAAGIPNQGAMATLDYINSTNWSTYIQAAVVDKLLVGRVDVIDTLQIKGGAVSAVYRSVATNKQSLGENSQTYVAQVSVPDVGASVSGFVDITAELGLGSDQDKHYWPVEVRLYRGSEKIWGRVGSVGDFLDPTASTSVYGEPHFKIHKYTEDVDDDYWAGSGYLHAKEVLGGNIKFRDKSPGAGTVVYKLWVWIKSSSTTPYTWVKTRDIIAEYTKA